MCWRGAKDVVRVGGIDWGLGGGGGDRGGGVRNDGGGGGWRIYLFPSLLYWQLLAIIGNYWQLTYLYT